MIVCEKCGQKRRRNREAGTLHGACGGKFILAVEGGMSAATVGGLGFAKLIGRPGRSRNSKRLQGGSMKNST